MRRIAALLCALALLACATTAPRIGGGPALWRIRNGSAVVYLLGTYHRLSRPFPWLTPTIEQALDASQEFWWETEASNQQSLKQEVMAGGFDLAYSLGDHLAPDTWAKVRATLVGCGVPATSVDHARPWLATFTLGFCAIRTRAGLQPSTPGNDSLAPDILLEQQATAQGKPVRGFVPIQQEIAALADLPDAELLAGLNVPGIQATTTVDLSPTSGEQAWLRGDLPVQDATSVAPFRSQAPETFALLLTRRSVLFADGIAVILQRPTTAFVAVGAWHMIGPDSVLALLASRGYTAERIE